MKKTFLLKTVIIEGQVTVLPKYTFAGTQNLKKVVLPDTLQIIEAEAFKDSSIEEIILPPHLTSIGARAFAGSGIRKITIPQSVTFIGQEAFASCNNLEYVSLPENLEIIKTSCFAYNSKLNFDLLTLPKNLKEIHPYAFLTALDDDKKCEIYIPETVEIIGDHAFPNNSTLFVTEKQLENNKHIKEFAHVDTSLEGKLNILLKEKALSLSQINKMFADKGR